MAFLMIIAQLIFTSNDCIKEYNFTKCDDNNPINGYWWKDSWVPGLPDYQSQFLVLPDSFYGIGVFYAPGVMKATADYRGLSMDGYLGGVALPTCSGINDIVWLKRSNYPWEGPYKVIDCARRNDLYGIGVILEESVEVDFDTAVRWGMVVWDKNHTTWSVLKWREDEVIVSFFPPQCTPEPVKLSTWLMDHITYSPYLDFITTIFYYPNEWRVGGDWETFNHFHTCAIVAPGESIPTQEVKLAVR